MIQFRRIFNYEIKNHMNFKEFQEKYRNLIENNPKKTKLFTQWNHSDLDKNKNLIPEINSEIINNLIEDNTISGGMIPKIKNCLDVACEGVKGVCIIDGRVKSSILFELLSEKGSGTLIRA